jgi:hypothetical protein
MKINKRVIFKDCLIFIIILFFIGIFLEHKICMIIFMIIILLIILILFFLLIYLLIRDLYKRWFK